MKSGYQPVVLFLVVWIRFLLALMLDQLFMERHVVYNIIRVLSLVVSGTELELNS